MRLLRPSSPRSFPHLAASPDRRRAPHLEAFMPRPLLALVLGVLALCALATPAAAQDSDNSINLHHLYLPLDGRGFYVVDGARTLRQGEVHLSLGYSHAHNPVEFGLSGDGRVRSLVRQLAMVDAGVAVGLLDGLSVGVALPFVVDNDGRELLDPGSRTRSGGVGALRVQVKYTLYDSLEPSEAEGEREADALELALAVQPFMTFHTGRARDYLSDNEAPTGGASLLLELELFERLRLGASLGYEFVSSDIDFGDLDIRDRIRFGAAAELLLLRQRGPRRSKADSEPAEERAEDGRPEDGGGAPREDEGSEEEEDANPHTLGLGLELYGWTDAGRPFHDERERPAEGLVYLRYRHALGLQLRLGAGAGLNNGVGAPDARYMASLGWTF